MGYQPPLPRLTRAGRDPWHVALLKTGGSMALSIYLYAQIWNWQFATGFVLLILVHELGHSLAMRYYGLSASPPIFIPFLGALINLRQPPRNALEEAVVGIGGPVTGTIGAAVSYAIYLNTHEPLFLLLAYFGFLLNLFNMLPVPPLDGGRVTAAVSPWIWMPGLAAVLAWMAYDYFTTGRVSFILLLLLLFAWPRIRSILSAHVRGGPYYNIGKPAQWGMGAAYILLGGILAVMFFLSRAKRGRISRTCSCNPIYSDDAADSSV